MESYSVMMSVYWKENPEYLTEAIESMLNQTVPTDDFVIVCDGPLTEGLDLVLETYREKYPEIFRIVRLPENVGIGKAAQTGLDNCRHDLVAKMDADDISVPFRCEKQLERFERNPELTVCGGMIEEFDKDPDKPFAVRRVPETDPEIRKFAKRRQPFNNVSVMYRRSAVQAVGGYCDLVRNEDFDLYIRLLHGGYRGENLPDVLVKTRVNREAVSRRASWATMKGCFSSRWRAFRIGYASFWDFCVCVGGQFVIFISPSGLQHFLYQTLFRDRKEKDGNKIGIV